MSKIKADLVDCMGSDLTVVNAARVSFNKQVHELGESDKRLIRYLARHNHWTPFSHPQITIRETVPMFVARQRFKHMVGFTYNEISRRYVDETPDFFYPDTWRSRPEASIKQGSGGEHDDQFLISGLYNDLINKIDYAYDSMIDLGVSPEQARMVLPMSTMTSYYVTGSLAAYARAYRQRSESSAQIEIQELAKKWDAILSIKFPVSWAALVEGATAHE